MLKEDHITTSEGIKEARVKMPIKDNHRDAGCKHRQGHDEQHTSDQHAPYKNRHINGRVSNGVGIIAQYSTYEVYSPKQRGQTGGVLFFTQGKKVVKSKNIGLKTID